MKNYGFKIFSFCLGILLLAFAVFLLLAISLPLLGLESNNPVLNKFFVLFLFYGFSSFAIPLIVLFYAIVLLTPSWNTTLSFVCAGTPVYFFTLVLFEKLAVFLKAYFYFYKLAPIISVPCFILSVLLIALELALAVFFAEKLNPESSIADHYSSQVDIVGNTYTFSVDSADEHFAYNGKSLKNSFASGNDFSEKPSRLMESFNEKNNDDNSLNKESFSTELSKKNFDDKPKENATRIDLSSMSEAEPLIDDSVTIQEHNKTATEKDDAHRINVHSGNDERQNSSVSVNNSEIEPKNLSASLLDSIVLLESDDKENYPANEVKLSDEQTFPNTAASSLSGNSGLQSDSQSENSTRNTFQALEKEGKSSSEKTKTVDEDYTLGGLEQQALSGEHADDEKAGVLTPYYEGLDPYISSESDLDSVQEIATFSSCTEEASSALDDRPCCDEKKTPESFIDIETSDEKIQAEEEQITSNESEVLAIDDVDGDAKGEDEAFENKYDSYVLEREKHLEERDGSDCEESAELAVTEEKTNDAIEDTQSLAISPTDCDDFACASDENSIDESAKNHTEEFEPRYEVSVEADTAPFSAATNVQDFVDKKEKMPIAGMPNALKYKYEVPPELLTTYPDNEYWLVDDATRRDARTLKETLREFKINVEIKGITKGPVVTMFELMPPPGIKLSKITSLQDNIALRLAAPSVRIVAPIPGKEAVGIEVPNSSRSIVSMRELIETDIPQVSKMAIPVLLGKDITGRPQTMDIAQTPHLLIAGATGSGKSVCVNSIIISILYNKTPEQVRLILVDPKIVELKLYNGIAHLLAPVITEPKKAFQALQYCLCEMERRYALLDSLSVRDIKSYNAKIKREKIATETLPYIVVIIDEFADLMVTTGKELESTVARLCAMSRAVGIHLVLATQRPSINVITGLIKANIPTRIAFMVASNADSRIILDESGAEKLLGKGDMLYVSITNPFPVRIQGTFVSDRDVETVVEHVKTLRDPEYIEDEMFIDEDEQTDSVFIGDSDPLYDKALEIVLLEGKASASYLQRRLKIGYNRAARIVEEMHDKGIVGPANGSKPREVIYNPN